MVDERIEKKEVPSPNHGPVVKMMGEILLTQSILYILSYLF